MAVIMGGRIIEGSGLDAPLLHAGAPTNNVTFVGVAVVGSQLIDTTNGVKYTATVATASTVTWVVVGSQS
jgi:hypothetical protein